MMALETRHRTGRGQRVDTSLLEGHMSMLAQFFTRYFSSGEINNTVKDSQAAIARVRAAYEDKCEVDELDGLTFTTEGWWFNIRASNTEPLLRLNVEANTQADMKKIRDAVLAVIKSR